MGGLTVLAADKPAQQVFIPESPGKAGMKDFDIVEDPLLFVVKRTMYAVGDHIDVSEEAVRLVKDWLRVVASLFLQKVQPILSEAEQKKRMQKLAIKLNTPELYILKKQLI